MTLTIAARTANLATLNTPLLVLLLPAGTEMPAHLKLLDKAIGGALGRTLRRGDFRGGRDETLHLGGGSRGPRRVLLVGYGAPSDRAIALRRAATLAARQGHRAGVGTLTISAGTVDATEAESILVGLQLGCWEYLDLRTPPPEGDRRLPLTEATLWTLHVPSVAAMPWRVDWRRCRATCAPPTCWPTRRATSGSGTGSR
jgi:leucyl aminopeptidase